MGKAQQQTNTKLQKIPKASSLDLYLFRTLRQLYHRARPSSGAPVIAFTNGQPISNALMIMDSLSTRFGGVEPGIFKIVAWRPQTLRHMSVGAHLPCSTTSMPLDISRPSMQSATFANSNSWLGLSFIVTFQFPPVYHYFFLNYYSNYCLNYYLNYHACNHVNYHVNYFNMCIIPSYV